MITYCFSLFLMPYIIDIKDTINIKNMSIEKVIKTPVNDYDMLFDDQLFLNILLVDHFDCNMNVPST